MRWTLDQLQQFAITAELGSFSAAARHLGKAQSAVSTAIGLLEADLGVELFDRSRRQAQLTDAGQLLLMEAQELLRQARALDLRARSFSEGSEAKLSLALDEALPYTAVSTLIKEISKTFSDLELTLLNGTATEVAEYVALQRAQVALHFDRGPVDAGFEQRYVGGVPQGIFVASGHPLTGKQSVSRKDLLQHRQLLMLADDVNETAYSPKVWRSDSFYSIAEMVSNDLGWAILPVNVAKDESYRQQLTQVSCPALALRHLSVRMLWLQGLSLSKTAQWVGIRFAQLLLQSPV